MRNNPALALLREAVEAWPQTEIPAALRVPGCIPDEEEGGEINGGDLVEWWGGFYGKARALLAGQAVADASRLARAETLLAASLDAWNDEEDSVKEEHADHIAELEAFIEGAPIPAEAGPYRKENPMPNCFALAIDNDDACELHLFATLEERESFLWDYAFENSGTEAETLADFKAELDDDLEEAMTATNDGWHTAEMVQTPEKLVVVLEGGMVSAVVGTGALVGQKVHVIDYDTDGGDDVEFAEIGQCDGTTAEAYLSEIAVELMTITLPEEGR